MNGCPIRNCKRLISDALVMCPRHWRMVPPPARQRVWATYRNREADPDAYERAVEEAKAAAEVAEEKGLRETEGRSDAAE